MLSFALSSLYSLHFSLVGVTGSGKGMTEYAQRNKHKYVADST